MMLKSSFGWFLASSRALRKKDVFSFMICFLSFLHSLLSWSRWAVDGFDRQSLSAALSCLLSVLRSLLNQDLEGVLLTFFSFRGAIWSRMEVIVAL